MSVSHSDGRGCICTDACDWCFCCSCEETFADLEGSIVEEEVPGGKDRFSLVKGYVRGCRGVRRLKTSSVPRAKRIDVGSHLGECVGAGGAPDGVSEHCENPVIG